MDDHSRWVLFFLLFLTSAGIAQTPAARRGIIDLSSVKFDEGTSVPLRGEVEFYMSALHDPSSFLSDTPPQSDFIDFPNTWNHLNKSLDPGQGYATYRLTILLPEPRQLALEIPHFYSNYRVWANGKVLAENGKVGTTRDESIPQWLPTTVLFDCTSDTLSLVIQASNFHHFLGGVRENLYLAAPEVLLNKKALASNSTWTMVAALFILGGALIVIRFVYRDSQPVVYLALLCLIWSLRSLYSNRYEATAVFPDFPWEVAVKIEYITLYLMMLFSMLFLASLFKTEVNSGFKYLFIFANAVFTLLTLVFDANFYTQFLPIYLSFAGALLLYILYVIVRAVAQEHAGVWYLVGSLLLSVLLFAYDILAYERMAAYNPVILSIGYLVIFVLLAIAVLYKIGFLKKKKGNATMLTYEDLYKTEKGA